MAEGDDPNAGNCVLCNDPHPMRKHDCRNKMTAATRIMFDRISARIHAERLTFDAFGMTRSCEIFREEMEGMQ